MGHESVVRKTQFPRLVIPLAVVLTAAFNFVLNLAVVFIFVLAFGLSPEPSWLVLIPVLLAIFVFTSAVAMIVSALEVSQISGHGHHLDGPVHRAVLRHPGPVSDLRPSPHLREVIALNPLAPLFGLAQRSITDSTAPWPGSAAAGGPVRLGIAIALYIGICVFAVVIFNREAPRIAEELKSSVSESGPG